MGEKIILSEQDREELVGLYKTAQTTPSFGLSSQQVLEGRDFASQAWDRVRDKMDVLGRKYGFDPGKMTGIKMDTGEVMVPVETQKPEWLRQWEEAQARGECEEGCEMGCQMECQMECQIVNQTEEMA